MVEVEFEVGVGVDSKHRAPELGGFRAKELPSVASNFLELTLLIM